MWSDANSHRKTGVSHHDHATRTDQSSVEAPQTMDSLLNGVGAWTDALLGPVQVNDEGVAISDTERT